MKILSYLFLGAAVLILLYLNIDESRVIFEQRMLIQMMMQDPACNGRGE